MEKKQTKEKPTPIGDILGAGNYEGDAIEFGLILNKEVVIYGFEIRAGTKYPGDFAILEIEVDGKKAHTMTGSAVIVDQLKKIEDRLPVTCTPKRVDKYYTLR